MNKKASSLVQTATILGFAIIVWGLAAPLATAAKTKNKTVGSGVIEGGASFAISAKDSGEQGVSGFARIEDPSFTAQGSVVCYTAEGLDKAVIVVEIENATGDVDPADNGMVIRVEDNGGPGSGKPDRMFAIFIEQPLPCRQPILFGLAEVVSGNIMVNHAGK